MDALALRADERRDKLRKASGRSKYPMIRRYLNGETRLDRLQSSIRQSITYGREPGELKHLSSRRKRKKERAHDGMLFCVCLSVDFMCVLHLCICQCAYLTVCVCP